MRKLIVANRKGGVGKTTTAVHIAAAFAMSGMRTLLIDTDSQGHCAKMLGVSPDTGLAELMEGKARPEEAVIQTRENLFLLSGSPTLAGTGRLIARQDFDSHLMLSAALEPYENQFAFVILDTNPSYSPLSVNVMFYGREVLIPVSMEALSVSGMMDLLGEMEPIRQRAGTDVKYILPTIADHRKKLTDELLPQLRQMYGDKVLHPISYLARMCELPATGKLIFEYDSRASVSLDYAMAAGEILRNGKA